ncbi:MAG: GNAT family N-acetyltransferase [Anaerolineae bacterium]|jgi:acetyltransferase
MQSGELENEVETVRLCDGTPVLIRPVRSDDAPRLQALFGRLSRESIYYRFLEFRKEMTHQEAKRLAELDYHTQMALVATRRQSGEEEVIGVARYAVAPGSEPAEAEAAIVVEDCYQNLGLGTQLLNHLAAYAVAHGVCAFLATVRFDNDRVLRVIRRSGLPIESRLEAGALALRIGLKRKEETVPKASHRRSVATERSQTVAIE